ncbi:MAG: exodeoxyribonuclease V subunit beta [Lysobacterales bacterium]
MTEPDLALVLPLVGTHLIEASAGTGKTYTIAGLYLRCIVERQLSVRDVLVVTFTRSATEELKQRLRQRLSLCADLAEAKLRGVAADYPSEQASEAGFAHALIEAALDRGELIRALALRLRLAAVSMDESAIQTIHGFCQRVLREHAFASGEALDAGELIGSDRDLIEQIAADFWRLKASDPAHEADFDVLQGKLATAEALAGLLLRLIDPDLVAWPRPAADIDDAAAELHAAIATEQAERERLLAAWRESGEQDLARIFAHAREGHLHQQTYKPESLAAVIAVCRDRFSVATLPPRAVLEKIGACRLREKTGKGRPPLPALRLAIHVDDWLRAATAVHVAKAQRWPFLLAAARTHASAQLEVRKQRAARQSYDDLVRRLHAAIIDAAHGARLAAALHARYPAVLVDEFQDTDTRQFEIFRRMQAVHADGALFLVGDPKQAIYRFRGGDIEAYLRAAAATAREPRRLARNFRSSPAFLRAIDAVFTQGAPEQAFVDPRIRFHPVEPGARVADDDVRVDGAPIMPLTAWHLRDGDVRPNKEGGRELLAHGCAEAIVALLRKANAGHATIRDRASGRHIALAPRHLAVLVATNDEVTLIQDALTVRGVASATIRQQSVFATGEAHDLQAFLGALDSREEAGLRAALASRLFGFDATALAAMTDPAQAQAWQGELQRLDALHRLWQQHGVLAMCERVFESRAAAILDSAGGERRMTNYLQLADLLQRESAHQFGAVGLIEWLRRRIAQADERNEEEQLRLESDADRVQIATIHASKGLEYDLVFLPFTALAPGVPNQVPTTFEWQTQAQRNIWVRAKGDEKNALATAAEMQSAREELAERVRVLYVALTRARYACWLSWDVIGNANGVPALAQLWHAGRMPKTSADARAALRRLAQAAPDAICITALPAAASDRLDPVVAADLPPARRLHAQIDSAWWISSFSQLREGQRSALGDASGADDEYRGDEASDADVAVTDAADADVADWPRGDRFGTAMHEILERTDFAIWRDHRGVALPGAERDAIAARLRRHALAPAEREAELQRVVARMLGTTLNTRLPGDLRLADLPAGERRAELPFHFAIAGVDPKRLIGLLHAYGYQQRRSDFARVHGRLAGLMTGVVDLVYRHDARWWIVDYKTNHLGARRADYAPAALDVAVREHDYDLQYLIYTLALHRWLRSRVGADYDYERDFGGTLYLFLRGLARDGSSGVHVDRPAQALIAAMDALLAPGIVR